MMPPKILIIGAGIGGLSLALSLHRTAHIPLSHISLHEIRPSPQTIGGAVNLTPPACRYLASLDALPRGACEVPAIEIFSHRTGRRLAAVDFDDVERFGCRGLRAKRGDILAALTQAWVLLGGAIEYGSELCGISEGEGEKVVVEFDGGQKTREECDFLIGADGIHSHVRMKYVEPSRGPEYSGVAGAYGMLSIAEGEDIGIPVAATSLFSSRRGSFMASFCDREKRELYVSAVMESPEVSEGREGWKVRGKDQESLKKEIVERLGGGGSMGEPIRKLVERVTEWYLFPVYKLPPHGTWSRGRVLLIGDAAHAMPPQGESMGIAIEDAMLLSRLLSEAPDSPILDIISGYERNRTAKIDAAFDEANFRWESVKDAGYVATLFKEYLTSAFLWWTKQKMDKNWEFDIRTAPLVE